MLTEIAIDGQTPDHFIREWRQHRGLTLQQVANMIDSTPASISRVEKGQVMLTWGVAKAIARVMRVPLRDMLFRNPNDEGLEGLFEEIRNASPEKQALIEHFVRAALAFAPEAKFARDTVKLINHKHRE